MELVLANFGTTFATRERARDIVATLSDRVSDELVLDLSGVTASPSFMAELLTQVSSQFLSLAFTGGSDHLTKLTSSLVEKLGLLGRVRELSAS